MNNKNIKIKKTLAYQSLYPLKDKFEEMGSNGDMLELDSFGEVPGIGNV